MTVVSSTEERPIYVGIEVRIQVNIWVGNDFNQDGFPVRTADVKDHAHLYRIVPEDTPLLTTVQVEDMAARCVQSINARIIDKL